MNKRHNPVSFSSDFIYLDTFTNRCFVSHFYVCMDAFVCRFVRRWFRGRTTCARCDVEFRPYSHSALADKRDSAVSKTPVKHNPVGPTAGPKDLRKPEPRPEEKVLNATRSNCTSLILHIYIYMVMFKRCASCEMIFLLG